MFLMYGLWSMEKPSLTQKGAGKKKLGKKGGLTSPLYGKKLFGLKLAKIGMM